MNKEKRFPRTYKSKDIPYAKAMKRAKRDKVKLSNILENVVTAYASGFDIKAVRTEAGGGRAIDVFSENFSTRLNEIKK